MKSRLNLQQCKLKVNSDETSHTVETCQGTNKNVIKRGHCARFNGTLLTNTSHSPQLWGWKLHNK